MDGRKTEKNKTERAGSAPYDTVAIFAVSQTGFTSISPSSAISVTWANAVSQSDSFHLSHVRIITGLKGSWENSWVACTLSYRDAMLPVS